MALKYKHIDGRWKSVFGISAAELSRRAYVVAGTVSEVDSVPGMGQQYDDTGAIVATPAPTTDNSAIAAQIAAMTADERNQLLADIAARLGLEV